MVGTLLIVTSAFAVLFRRFWDPLDKFGYARAAHGRSWFTFFAGGAADVRREIKNYLAEREQKCGGLGFWRTFFSTVASSRFADSTCRP
jgi:hypothetical protein